MVKYVKTKRCYKGVYKHFYILKKKEVLQNATQRKALKNIGSENA